MVLTVAVNMMMGLMTIAGLFNHNSYKNVIGCGDASSECDGGDLPGCRGV